MRRSTSAARRACAVGTTIALIGLTTGLGIMTATSASAAEPVPPVSDTASAPAATGTQASGSDTQPDTIPSTGSTSDGAATPEGGAAAGSNDGASGGDMSEPGPVQTAPGANPSDGTTPDTGTTPDPGTTAPPTTTAEQPTKQVRAAAAQIVTITGDAAVGSDLSVKQQGFTAGSSFRYEWKTGTDVVSTDPVYTVAASAAGQVITVTVFGTPPGETVPTEQASAETDTAVPPVFLNEDGTPITDDDDPDAYIEATAGVAFSHTFRALSTPAPTLSIVWFDEDGDAQSTLPEGVTFTPATGVLSGTLTDADQNYEFDVTATTTTPSGTVSSDQYASISLEAGAPAGIEVFSVDKGALLDGTADSAWIIHPNGDVYTESLLGDGEPVKGGKISVAQGGTLLVGASNVDEYGNDVFPEFDENGDPVTVTPTVTSDVATDVIKPDADLGIAGFVSVTFPHASTHTLTVSSAPLPSTRFAVDVRPSVVPTVVPTQPIAPVVTVHHTATGAGRLAYTGTDATGALPWALGLVLAGIGLIGARTVRRRRAQR